MAKVMQLLGTKIHCHIVEFNDGSGSVKAVQSKSYSNHLVVYENDKNFVIDNENLTSVGKEVGYGVVLNKPIVQVRLADSYWGNTIYFMLYTDKVCTKKDIKSMIQDKVKSKVYDFLSVDLDFITEGNEDEQ